MTLTGLLAVYVFLAPVTESLYDRKFIEHHSEVLGTVGVNQEGSDHDGH